VVIERPQAVWRVTDEQIAVGLEHAEQVIDDPGPESRNGLRNVFNDSVHENQVRPPDVGSHVLYVVGREESYTVIKSVLL
jgi:hypothetical protein